jgi:IS30 family transposase
MQQVTQKSGVALSHKGKRKKPQETRGRFNVGTSITKRHKEVRKRETFGHWELDSAVLGRGKSKGCLATFLERKTRWYIAIKMPDRTAVSMEAAIHRLHKEYPKGSMTEPPCSVGVVTYILHEAVS